MLAHSIHFDFKIIMYMLDCLRMKSHEMQYDYMQYKKDGQHMYNEKNYINKWLRKE